MNAISGVIIIAFLCLTNIAQTLLRADSRHMIITAIQDNGCSSHQELSPTKSNADVYNYAALSTGYNKGIKDDR